VTVSASKVCCRSIAACILGPTLVLVPSQAAKIKVVGFPTVTGAGNRECTVLTYYWKNPSLFCFLLCKSTNEEFF